MLKSLNTKKIKNKPSVYRHHLSGHGQTGYQRNVVTGKELFPNYQQWVKLFC